MINRNTNRSTISKNTQIDFIRISEQKQYYFMMTVLIWISEQEKYYVMMTDVFTHFEQD
jgi:hypothetical protein